MDRGRPEGRVRSMATGVHGPLGEQGDTDRVLGRSARSHRGAFHAARGIPHTYRVESDTARWLAFSDPAGFETFVRAVGVPAETEDLPPAGRPQDPDALAAAAARQGIELLGPPGMLP